MTDDTIMDPLVDNGFEAVETDLPGDWVSNGKHTIQITCERSFGGREREIVARLYDAPAESFGLGVECIRESESKDNVRAVELVLDPPEGVRP